MATNIKSSFFLILFLLSFQLDAQKINGVVKNKSTGQPIENVAIITQSYASFTSSLGKFSLSNIHIGDTIKFSCVGYLPYYLSINKIGTDTIVIHLEQHKILLNEVTINGVNNYKMDSLKRRKEYASLFNHKALSFKDIFISKTPHLNNPYPQNIAPNNTTSIISINLLSAIGLISKSKAPESKMQKLLKRDEEENYINHLFSKRKVAAIIPLKDDSLTEFMNRYRPSAEELRKMTDYNLILYIKNNYKQFKNKR